MKYQVGQVIVIHSPIRMYKITGTHEKYGYNATYIGPGTQTIENALVSISHDIANKEHYVRLATKAEIVLYTKCKK